MTGHDQSLFLELLGDIARGGAGHLDPSLGEYSAGDKHVSDKNGSFDRVEESFGKVERWRHVVGQTTSSVKLSATLARLPDTDEAHEQVVGEAAEEHLRDEEDVGGQRGLQHDGHVRGVEEADGVGAAHAALAGGLDGDFDAEALQVDDGAKDDERCDEIHDVGEVLAVEGFLESELDFVRCNVVIGTCHLFLPACWAMSEGDAGER